MSSICCGTPITEPGTAARASTPTTDACGCPVDEQPTPHTTSKKSWLTIPLLFSAVSGIFLACGYIIHPLFFIISFAIGASQFVPEAVKRCVTGPRRLTIGLLMTIAAIGAIALGRIGSAAALAFLFSLAEALEHAAMVHARSSLGSLMTLMPSTAEVITRAEETTQAVAVEEDSCCTDASLPPAKPSCNDPCCEDTSENNAADIPCIPDNHATAHATSGNLIDAATTTIPTRELAVGDMFRVLPGERVATDGIVVEGRAAVNNAAVTGESIPLPVDEGESVTAGAVVVGSPLVVKATQPGDDNTLTTIVELITAAARDKGTRARLADSVAAPLIPLVVGVSIAVAAIGSLFGSPAVWIERALVVLVAASPCALAIAVPVTAIAAISAASRQGIVIRSGAAFENLGAVTHVAFDKTGTLTTGEPAVVAVEGAEDTVALAATLETHSTHPLATAITEAADANSVPAGSASMSNWEESPGVGVRAQIDGRSVSVTSPAHAQDLGDFKEAIRKHQEQGQSVVVVCKDGEAYGIIAIADQIRDDTADTVARLHNLGVKPLMLSGDNTPAARAVGSQVGIPASNIFAELTPEDKARIVADYKDLAMVGDGINDAPALARASVGVAMGEGATDVAVDSADVALTGTSLASVVTAVAHARRARRIMTVNIGLALCVIIALPPLAVSGILGLGTVVLLHEAAEVVIIANGLRAARVKDDTR